MITNFWAMERPIAQSFYREIRLPARVDVDHVKASLEDGDYPHIKQQRRKAEDGAPATPPPSET